MPVSNVSVTVGAVSGTVGHVPTYQRKMKVMIGFVEPAQRSVFLGFDHL